jgi:hypothetical protein
MPAPQHRIAKSQAGLIFSSGILRRILLTLPVLLLGRDMTWLAGPLSNDINSNSDSWLNDKNNKRNVVMS